MFGRKGVNPPGATPPADRSHHPDGHRHVLEHLECEEAENPQQRAQLAGKVVFDFVCQMVQSDRGIRIEDLIAVLASNGGYACIEAAMDRLRELGQTPKEAGMLDVGAKDGSVYYFGDLPNRFLCESELALLSLALGMAQHCGGAVSLEMIHDCMKRTAASIGGPAFGMPVVPEGHLPGDLPINYVTHIWPEIRKALETYEVPPQQRPATLGFALQRAIDAGKAALDPGMAARIAVECAVPMAKLDPARFRQKAA